MNHELGKISAARGGNGRRDFSFAYCACGHGPMIGGSCDEVSSKYAAHIGAAVDVEADRADPRWLRIRAALCPITTLRIPLDEYADRVWMVVTKNANGHGSPSLDGSGAAVAEGGGV